MDLENVNITNPDVLNVIVYIFKYCNSQNGSLKLCNVSNAVNEALSYIFLDGVIPVFKNKASAIMDFNQEIETKEDTEKV